VTLAAHEGPIRRRYQAGVAVIGPQCRGPLSTHPIDIPVPSLFSPTANFGKHVHDWTTFPRHMARHIELLYYSFHTSITLGTIFSSGLPNSGIQTCAALTGSSRWLLWVLELAVPQRVPTVPTIATRWGG